MTDLSDWNRNKAINSLEEVTRTSNKYTGRKRALNALAATPNEEIEALIKEWRAEREDRDPNTLSNVATLAKLECALELEALLE
jgi:hypothetical protein